MEIVALQRLAASSLNETGRAAVILWFEQRSGNQVGLTPASIADELERGGSAGINRSRLKQRLDDDPRFIKATQGCFKLSPRRADDVGSLAEPILGPSRPTLNRELIDSGLFSNAHGYVKNVVSQISVSYENDCQDCAAVMIRRLFETLIVDAFEARGQLSEITDGNGNIFQLSGLISAVGRTQSFSVSRQTKDASKHLKDIGDWSAHNRQHKARKSDIDAVAKHLRLASGDLLHLARQD